MTTKKTNQVAEMHKKSTLGSQAIAQAIAKEEIAMSLCNIRFVLDWVL